MDIPWSDSCENDMVFGNTGLCPLHVVLGGHNEHMYCSPHFFKPSPSPQTSDGAPAYCSTKPGVHESPRPRTYGTLAHSRIAHRCLHSKSAVQCYIHIGFPKAASRTLQEALFANVEGAAYIGRPAVRHDPELRDLTQVITDRERYEFDQEFNEFSRRVSDVVGDSARVLLSAESFCCGSSLPGKVDRKTIAERLGALFPAARILIVIRRQDRLLQSLFAQTIKGSGEVGLWRDWLEEQKGFAGLTSWFTSLKFDTLYDIYAGIFGAENVYVVLFEDFVVGDERFFSAVGAFLGLESDAVRTALAGYHVNRRATVWEAFAQRIRPHRLIGPLARRMPGQVKESIKNLAGRGRAIDPEYTEQDKEFMVEYFRHTNSYMAEVVGRDLRELGYPM